MNIIDEVQKLTGHAPVEKINPNTQTPQAEINDNTKELLPQAAIPVALIGLYKYTRSEDNAARLAAGNNSASSSLTDELFGDQAGSVIEHVSSYAHVSNDRAKEAIDNAALSGVQVANKAAGTNATGAAISAYFASERNEILKYLPASLQLGYLINDNTIDDRTNKMEGPMSGLMHSIENLFSDSDANDSTKQ